MIIQQSRHRPRRAKRRRACLLAGLTAVLMPVLCAPAQARELLVVGTHFERIYELGKDGEYRGLGAEIVRQVAKRLGDTVSFHIYPWARAQEMVAQGKADILVGPYRSPERLARLAFSARPFYQDQMLFYVRADSAIAWNGDYAALRGQRIVALNGWVYSDAFERARPTLQIGVANTLENGLQMLVHEHADLFAANRRGSEPVIAQLGYAAKVTPMRRAIDVQNGYFAFPKGGRFDPLRIRFNLAFHALAESGELKRLGKRLDVHLP